jgi:Ca2+-binding EF-hand superfamily protein
MTKCFLIVLLFTAAMYCQNTEFERWDRDGNREISKDEFIYIFNNVYVNDRNLIDNEYLDDEDFYEITFHRLDINNDNYLSDVEWDWGYNHLLVDYDITEYSIYDVDDNNLLDFAEFLVIVNKINYFPDRDLDRDGYLNRDELAQDVFNSWDADNNQRISEEEFADFYAFIIRIR